MKKLYLDDRRTPKPELGFIVVRTVYEMIQWIEKHGLPDVITFDHDLADEHVEDYMSNLKGPLNYKSYKEKTGYDAVKWLVEYCINNELKLPECYTHSANLPGRTNIIAYINNFMEYSEDREGTCKFVQEYQ